MIHFLVVIIDILYKTNLILGTHEEASLGKAGGWACPFGEGKGK